MAFQKLRTGGGPMTTACLFRIYPVLHLDMDGYRIL